jgi:hypothetical protein
MTKRDPQQLTEAEMNDLVFADVNDPSAWGAPVVVGPSRGPRRIKHAKHLELAAKFYVLSVLHRLGADATLTFSQPDNVDITVVLESGFALTVDVKTLTGPMEWPIGDFSARARHFLAFVWYADPNELSVPPDVYIAGSEQLRDLLAHFTKPTLSLALLDEEIRARDAWQQLVVSSAA